MHVARSNGLTITVSILLLVSKPSHAGWLEFGPGCPENSEPRTVHNISLEDFISFDVELSGLRADTIEHDDTDYVRFNRSPGTRPMDETGYPEIPIVSCFIAIPDEADLVLDFTANCMSRVVTIPVYPAPLDSLVEDSTCTPRYEELFRKDSAAYVSDEWYPAKIAVLSGEFMLRDQRVAIVDVYPVQYLASEDSLRAWSDIEVSLTFEGADPAWIGDGLGYYNRLIGDRLLGYTPEYSYEPVTEGNVYRPDDLVSGPPVVPDYVIIVPDGLDGRWIDDFAEYRATLNGFDVAIATTGDIYDQFNEGSQYLTPDVIRNFTEAMWDWGTPGNRSTYLLLIGDHEDYSCMVYPWFLPTEESCEHGYGNDEWLVYFDEPRDVISSFPDMMVARLPARDPDKLQDMFDLIYDYESEDVPPGPVNRRQIIRLAGTEEDGSENNGEDNWGPSPEWTESLVQWLGYDWDNYYCGDGEDTFNLDPPNPDGSSMTSADWVQACTDVFERGSEIVIYTNHGDFHMFSAGLNWEPGCPPNFGAPDSCFDNIDVMNLVPDEDHWHPFLLLLCCSAGTFNHTEWEHDNINNYPGLCADPGANPPYDFLSDCLAEDFMLNTDCGAIGVFAGSNSSFIGCYHWYGRGPLTAIFERGITRIGDAIASMRFQYLDVFLLSDGTFKDDFARFNLLGDPAVDMGDRVKFRDCCDLIISPADLEINEYPTISVNGGSGDPELYCTVRNAGAVASGSFDVTLDVIYEEQTWNLSTSCPSLDPGEERTLQIIWEDAPSDVQGWISLQAEADPQNGTPDSWRGNNTAEADVEVIDFYPNEDGWPARTAGSVYGPPILCNLDEDTDLEIVIATTYFVEAWDIDDNEEPIWRSGPFFMGNADAGYTIPVAADVCGGPQPEIILDTRDRLIVLDGATGSEICSMEHDLDRNFYGPHTVTVADIFGDRAGLEIALVCMEEEVIPLSLFVLGIEDGQIEILDKEDLYQSRYAYSPDWITALDCTPDGSVELGVAFSWYDEVSYNSGIWVYDHVDRTQTSEFIGSREWTHDRNTAGIPSAGALPSAGLQLALSRQYSAYGESDPAMLLDPDDLSSSVDCEAPEEQSDWVLCCVMADWLPPSGEVDNMIANAENQVMAWYEDGSPVSGWQNNVYLNDGNARPPFPALGELDDQDLFQHSDLITATKEGTVYGFASTGVVLGDLSFPYTLPAYVNAGFAIADIDNDGYVEVVFGTTDDYLHVWELGECDPGYSPWLQCQHDAARTGVLLE